MSEAPEQLALFEDDPYRSRTFDEYVELASIRYISHSMHETVWESYTAALTRYYPGWTVSAPSFAEWLEAVAYQFAKEGRTR